MHAVSHNIIIFRSTGLIPVQNFTVVVDTPHTSVAGIDLPPDFQGSASRRAGDPWYQQNRYQTFRFVPFRVDGLVSPIL